MARFFMRSHITLGRNLALEVPVLVECVHHKGYRGSRDDPPEPEHIEANRVERTDGLAWHDRCDDAFDLAWSERIEAEAWQHMRDEDDYHADFAAELARERWSDA